MGAAVLRAVLVLPDLWQKFSFRVRTGSLTGALSGVPAAPGPVLGCLQLGLFGIQTWLARRDGQTVSEHCPFRA